MIIPLRQMFSKNGVSNLEMDQTSEHCYIMSPSQYHESNSIPSGKGYLNVQGWKKVAKGPRLVKGDKSPRLAKSTYRSSLAEGT